MLFTELAKRGNGDKRHTFLASLAVLADSGQLCANAKLVSSVD
jgi:hypothetical protein